MKIKMNNKVVISVEDISKKYTLYNSKNERLKEALILNRKKYHREHNALSDINFEVRKGECLAVVGKNGSGKSTLLQIIAGLVKPTHGSVKVQGKVLALVQLGATFNSEFTGLENVNLYATAMGYSRQEIKNKLPEILRFADIDDFINQKVKTYSSGMKARLAFSVVVSLEPEILIIDEVLSVGDMFFKQKCINKLKQMIENGLTLFFVSHSLNDVKSMCKKALYLDKGKVMAFGDVNEVLNLYQNSMTKSNLTMQRREKSSKSRNINSEEVRLLSPSEISNDYKCPNLANSTERSGNNTISYFKIALVDRNGRECNHVTIFDTVTIVAYFDVNAKLDPTCDLGLVCKDPRGYDIFVINSSDHHLSFDGCEAGSRYSWVIEIPKLLLSPGIYSLNIGAKPKKGGNVYYDRIFNACVFEVMRSPEMLNDGNSIHGCFFCETNMRVVP